MENNFKEWIDIILLSSCVNIVHVVKLAKWTLGQVFSCWILVHPTVLRAFSQIFNQLIIIEYLLQTSQLVNGNNSSKKSIMVSIHDLIDQLKILK